MRKQDFFLLFLIIIQTSWIFSSQFQEKSSKPERHIHFKDGTKEHDGGNALNRVNNKMIKGFNYIEPIIEDSEERPETDDMPCEVLCNATYNKPPCIDQRSIDDKDHVFQVSIRKFKEYRARRFQRTLNFKAWDQERTRSIHK